MIAPHIILSCFAFVFGALVGSFLNVCICRLPKEESVVFPPSHCTRCDYRIRWYDNIPMLSYALLRGRCRRCGETISLQYPLVEFINGGLTLALFLKFGPSFAFVVLFLLCSALVVVTFIDLEHQIIPDVITLPGIVIGFIASFFIPGFGWLNSLIGIVAGGGSLLLVAYGYQAITKKDGMGGGRHQAARHDGGLLRLEGDPLHHLLRLPGRLGYRDQPHGRPEEGLLACHPLRALPGKRRGALHLLRQADHLMVPEHG